MNLPLPAPGRSYTVELDGHSLLVCCFIWSGEKQANYTVELDPARYDRPSAETVAAIPTLLKIAEEFRSLNDLIPARSTPNVNFRNEAEFLRQTKGFGRLWMKTRPLPPSESVRVCKSCGLAKNADDFPHHRLECLDCFKATRKAINAASYQKHKESRDEATRKRREKSRTQAAP